LKHRQLLHFLLSLASATDPSFANLTNLSPMVSPGLIEVGVAFNTDSPIGVSTALFRPSWLVEVQRM
jgi:hypothetical protein